ncbi:hypothetical protein RHSIM_Rhsim09G0090900 [Rhododendron simsii]|uniref:CCHC-type domain-containing protein n=1 Tax=Rhododendron simsii TaxID=118357 RepID=A0A834GGV7_RHOSS|nr:hypothetical protein RHSIM_Rhsim09G0090900 [Rhododendron simsii]
MAEFDILDLEEGSDETGVSNNHCLVGKVIQTKILNASIITNILAAAWKTRAPYQVSDWNNNVLLFRFEDSEDKRLVLQDGPWSIMNSLLVLKPLENNMVVSEIQFQHCPFWVQIHGLPVEKMCRAKSEIIGKRFGKLIAIEAAPSNMLLSRSFLRIKVEINISQPIPKGFMLQGKTGRDLWISYVYERLPDFCYACGRIGHDKCSCRFTAKGTESHSGYGPKLRTGRARKIDVPIEDFSREEEGVVGGTRNILSQPPEMEGRDVIAIRLPELQRNEDNVARVGVVAAKRVLSPWVRQDKQTSAGVGVPHSTNDDVLSGTGVKRSTAPGNIPNIILLGGALRISNFVPSGSSVSLSESGSDSVLKPILTTQIFSLEPKSPNSSGAVTSLAPGIPMEVALEIQRLNRKGLVALGELVRKNRPSIIFLMETKNHKAKMEAIRRNLMFDESSYVEPEGFSGGLALWWTKDVEVDVELVMSVEDKLGGNLPSQNSLSSFHDMISKCGLVDLEFKGPKFTWRNNCIGDNFIMERIDMAFANAKWRELHDQALVFVETAIGSDHNPLLLKTTEALNKVGKPFKFESFWVTKEECKEVVSEAWCQRNEGSKMYNVCKKLRGCKEKLKLWSFKKFGNLRLKIAVTKDQLAEVQKQIENGF